MDVPISQMGGLQCDGDESIQRFVDATLQFIGELGLFVTGTLTINELIGILTGRVIQSTNLYEKIGCFAGCAALIIFVGTKRSLPAIEEHFAELKERLRSLKRFTIGQQLWRGFTYICKFLWCVGWDIAVSSFDAAYEMIYHGSSIKDLIVEKKI